ncbi:MAG: cysteine synthase family protein [Termitinemataceae bacterium]|nr:MAG: cysteine synthase family protein [Termitinemataceae bacterium]
MVGNTPLVELKLLGEIPCGVRILAKAEFMNPSGSVKDRAVRAMLLEGIESGALCPGKTIIDATSGNSGISYAMMGAFLGYPVTIYQPANASFERKKMIKTFGAEIVETDPMESSDGAFNAVQAVFKAEPAKWFYPDQYNNDANWKAHYKTTAEEIWAQSNGEITHFVSVTGTSGTFMGNSRRLKELNPAIKVYAVQPDSPMHGIEGTKHLESTLKPGFFDETIADGFLEVSTDESYNASRALANGEWLFVGVSAGANVEAALKLAKSVPQGSVIVTVLCDSGSRYLSDEFWEEQ